MAAEKPELDGFLAVIERKIAALKALADSYRTALSLGALGQPGEVDSSAIGATTRNEAPMELPKGALLGKSLPAAIELYLSAVRGKQTIREVANALKEHGVESTSDNFENVVSGALNRLKAQGKVLRFKDGFAHADLYPAALRSNLAKEAKPAKKGKAASKGKRTRTVAAVKNAARAVETPKHATQPTTTSKASVGLDHVKAHRADGATIDSLLAALVAAGFDTDRKFAGDLLWRLCNQGQAEKRDGRYFPVSAKPHAAA